MMDENILYYVCDLSGGIPWGLPQLNICYTHINCDIAHLRPSKSTSLDLSLLTLLTSLVEICIMATPVQLTGTPGESSGICIGTKR